LIVFIAVDDDANDPAFCIKMGETKRKDGHPPLKVIVYKGALHGYMDNLPFRYVHGWRMGYSHSAAQDTVGKSLRTSRAISGRAVSSRSNQPSALRRGHSCPISKNTGAHALGRGAAEKRGT
jgi:hypothetical protein